MAVIVQDKFCGVEVLLIRIIFLTNVYMGSI